VSLALRLLARIVLLDLAVFFIYGSNLDGVGAFVADNRVVQGFDLSPA
jgi:hypothetical protein